MRCVKKRLHVLSLYLEPTGSDFSEILSRPNSPLEGRGSFELPPNHLPGFEKGAPVVGVRALQKAPVPLCPDPSPVFLLVSCGRSYRSYHGGTLGAMAVTGDQRRWTSEPGAVLWLLLLLLLTAQPQTPFRWQFKPSIACSVGDIQWS